MRSVWHLSHEIVAMGRESAQDQIEIALLGGGSALCDCVDQIGADLPESLVVDNARGGENPMGAAINRQANLNTNICARCGHSGRDFGVGEKTRDKRRSAEIQIQHASRCGNSRTQ
jgi:hypothetical protein